MAKKLERRKAIELRKQGKSYSQIKKVLKVSKGTLSCWLRDYPLSKQRIRELRDWNEQRIESYRQTMQQKREKRLNDSLEKARNELLPISKKELLIAGLFLYWGEGLKNLQGAVSISNTDPSVLKFTIFWLTQILKIPKKKLKFMLHLYKDMDIEKEHCFWSKELKIPLSQFNRPYIKQTTTQAIDHSGFKHGTCKISVHDVRLKEQIMMSIKAIADKYKMGV